MKQRPAFILPLVLIFLLVGGALIAVSFDIATKSQNQAMQMVTTGTLYNAAQDGIERGKSKLLEHREELDHQENPEEYTISTPPPSHHYELYATYTSGTNTYRVDDVSTGNDPWSLTLNGIPVQVEIFDCNYTLSSGPPSAENDFPPIMPPTSQSDSANGNHAKNLVNGTTVIMDPNRVNTSGSESYPQHYYVIRSRATDDNSGRERQIETMVVING